MIRNIFCSLLIIIVWSCQDSSNVVDESAVPQDEWTVDNSNISGAIGLYDLMNSPNFNSVSEINDLSDSSKVALVSFKNEVRVYPYHYTNHFEIVNDFLTTII